MVEKPVPSRTHRTCGHVFATLTSVLIGYSAWAGQPRNEVPSGSADVLSPASGQTTAGTRRAAIVRAKSTALRPQVLSWPSDLESFYPTAAKTHDTEGMVRIAVSLDEAGRATDTRILSVTPQGMGFGAAASTMVHFMTFSNPTGRSTIIRLPVKFALQHAAQRHHHRSLKERVP